MTGPQYAALQRSFDSFVEFFKNSAYGRFPQKHLHGGSFGLTVFEIDMEPLDLIDSAVPELLIQRTKTCLSEIVVDLGDGCQRTTQHSPNSIIMSPPDTQMRYCVPESASWTMASVPATTVRSILDEAGVKHSKLGRYFGRLIPNSSAAFITDQIWRVASTLSTTATLYLDGLLLHLLAILTSEAALSPLGHARPEDARIARAIDYAEAHLGEALTVAEIATVACLSPGHFTRCFKATMGEPVWAYVQRRRGERALELLLMSQLPVAEIAYRCGFANQSHLTSCFKQQFGTTPAQARREALT